MSALVQRGWCFEHPHLLPKWNVAACVYAHIRVAIGAQCSQPEAEFHSKRWLLRLPLSGSRDVLHE